VAVVVCAVVGIGAMPAPGTQASPYRLRVDAVAYSLPGKTTIGIPVRRGVVAVDPKVIPLRSRLHIPGYGRGIAADVGTAVKGRIIDLWFPTRAEARAWGRRTVVITVYP
jgi:3D (Asp-Asp-Asp) domain-containing protein